MEIIKKIDTIISDPMKYNNEFSLAGLHIELVDALLDLDEITPKNSDTSTIEDDVTYELQKCCEKLKHFYLKYYMILYKNSIAEIKSNFFKTPANAIHSIIKEDVENSKILQEEEGLEYYSYKRDYREIDEFAKFDSLDKLHLIVNEMERNREMDIDESDETPNRKKARNRLYDDYVTETVKPKSTDEEGYEWNLEDLVTGKQIPIEEEDDHIDDLTASFKNLFSSNMKDFFSDHEKKINILDLKISDYLELFLPHTADKVSMHFFYEYMKLTDRCDPFKTGDYSCKNYCYFSIKFGLNKLFLYPDKKIREYTLKDIYETLINFVDCFNVLFKCIDAINTNELFQYTTIKKDIMSELVFFMTILYRRLYTVISSGDESLIDVDMFKHAIYNQNKNKMDYMVNTMALYYFSHAYRYIFSTLQFDTYFLSIPTTKQKIKHIKHVDCSFVNPNFSTFISNKFEKFMSNFKGKKSVSDMYRWFMYKFCSSSMNRDWFVYWKMNGDLLEQLATIDLIRDNAKLQRKVIETFEPSCETWLFEAWKKILVNITDITDLKHKDIVNQKNIQDDLNGVLNGDDIKDDVFSSGLKMEYRTACALYATHIWFMTSKGYKYWMYRYVIPFESFIRYGYIILKMIMDDPDKIYTEPFIIGINQFEFSVLYNKHIYYCGKDYFKALYMWLSFMETHFNNTIFAIKSHSEVKKMECYYIWVYVWKKIYFPKNLVLMDFFNSLSNDSLDIGDVFSSFKKEEKKEKVKVLTEVVSSDREIVGEEKQILLNIFGDYFV